MQRNCCGSIPCYSPNPYPDGTHAIDLNGLSTGGITQDFSGLAPNSTYELSFYLSGNGVLGPPLDLQLVIASGAVTESETFNSTAWQKNIVDVPVGADGHANITFQSNTAGTGGPTIDAISLVPVPLPGSLKGGLPILAMVGVMKLASQVKRR